jgi:hypothetical protein
MMFSQKLTYPPKVTDSPLFLRNGELCSLCTFKVPQGANNLILCTLDTIHRLFVIKRTGRLLFPIDINDVQSEVDISSESDCETTISR